MFVRQHHCGLYGLLLLALAAGTASAFPRYAAQLQQSPKQNAKKLLLLQHTTLKFRFPGVSFDAGMRHIHAPEHIAETHRLGAPFFRIRQVQPPVLTDERSAVVFLCSTLLTPHMRVVMFSTRPDQSNLLFFVGGRALYTVRLTAEPSASLDSHTLRLDITFFLAQDYWLFRALRLLLPVFLLVNGLEDRHAFAAASSYAEDAHLAAYRAWVLRGVREWSERHFM